ncbi:MAG: hypothetical protein IJM74_09875, partial [Bacteroidales bacterium]|nr:hypothetical protein [Bacteroidales bacterium]
MLINHKHLSAAVVVLFFLFMSDIAIAQPGGGPGGRPMGPPPGGRNGRPSMSERERMRKQYQAYQAAEKSQQIRQKKKVAEGDLFKVVGT